MDLPHFVSDGCSNRDGALCLLRRTANQEGIRLTQFLPLFVGPNCLVVEGPSDLLYLQVITNLLQEKNRTSLSEEWTVTPVAGSDKVPTFVALLGAQKGLKVATLIDVQNKDRQKIENLYKSKLLKRSTLSPLLTSLARARRTLRTCLTLPFI